MDFKNTLLGSYKQPKKPTKGKLNIDQVHPSELRAGLRFEYDLNPEKYSSRKELIDFVLKNLNKNENWYTNLIAYGKGNPPSKNKEGHTMKPFTDKDKVDKDNAMKPHADWKKPKDTKSDDKGKVASKTPKGVEKMKNPAKKYKTIGKLLEIDSYQKKKST